MGCTPFTTGSANWPPSRRHWRQLDATTRTEWAGYRQAFTADTTSGGGEGQAYEEATSPGYAWFRQG
ncbi:MAG: hypothetical protein WKG07_03715 [Hymenobacter sp.]